MFLGKAVMKTQIYDEVDRDDVVFEEIGENNESEEDFDNVDDDE